MKKITVFIIAFLLIIPVGFTSASADGQGFTLLAVGPTVYRAGDSFNVMVNVNNIKLDGGMSYVSFRLYYDKTKVVPIIKNGFTDEYENRTDFIVKCPDFESWEVIGILDEKECFYELTFGTENVSGVKTAKGDNDLVFNIPFTVISGTSGDIKFTFPAEYVYGGNASLSQREVPGVPNDVIVKDPSFNNITYNTGVNNISDTSKIAVYGDKPLSVLSDGDKAMSAASGSDPGVVLFRNLISSTAGAFPSAELVLALENETTVNTLSLCFFYDLNNGIGLPKDNIILISYSTEPTSFSVPMHYNLQLNTQGSCGVAEAIVKLEKPVKAKYIKLAFCYGSSLQGGNSDLEFIGMTELSAFYKSDEDIDPFELTVGGKIRIEDGYLLGLTDGVTAEQIKSYFRRDVTVNGVGTGSTVTAGGRTLVIVISGEISGDGIIDSTDYLIAKKACLGNTTLTAPQLKAACLEGEPLPTSLDILKIKKHILGNYNIHDYY